MASVFLLGFVIPVILWNLCLYNLNHYAELKLHEPVRLITAVEIT
jgi:hypothetical protein